MYVGVAPSGIHRTAHFREIIIWPFLSVSLIRPVTCTATCTDQQGSNSKHGYDTLTTEQRLAAVTHSECKRGVPDTEGEQNPL